MEFFSPHFNLVDATCCFADAAPTFNSGAGLAKDFDPTGWELALVSTPSSDISAANERQLVVLNDFYILLLQLIIDSIILTCLICHV